MFFSKTNVQPPNVDIRITGEKIDTFDMEPNLNFKKRIQKMIYKIGYPCCR